MSIKEIIDNIKSKNNFAEIAVQDFAPDGKWASQVARALGEKTNQLRKVFNELKRMEIQQKGKQNNDKFEDPKIYLLIPQLAYAKARKLIRDEFYELVKTIIGDGTKTMLKTVGDYRRFIEFMTAIVAYHKK